LPPSNLRLLRQLLSQII